MTGRVVELTIGWFLLGTVLALILAIPLPSIAIIVFAVAVGPFLAFCLAFMVAFGLGVMLHGDPDRYINF